jgi:hypothetical protein
MANEIRARELGTSGTYYYVLIRNADNFYYNGTTFEAYNAANYATQYARQVAAPNAQGDYVKDFPGVAAGNYDVKIRQRVGGAAAETDPPVILGAQNIPWSGTAAIDSIALANYVDTVETGIASLASTLAAGVGLADNAITAAKINDGAITAAKLAANAIESAAIKDGALTNAKFAAGSIKKNTAFNNFPFVMLDTSGNPKTGLGTGITAQRRIDNGSYAACANTPAEVANGSYDINLAAGDLNGNAVTLRFTASGCRPTLLTIFPQP